MRTILIGVIKLYQWLVSPLFLFLSMFGLRMQCKYPVTCSNFAMEEIRTTNSITKSLLKILIRIISCGPQKRLWKGNSIG